MGKNLLLVIDLQNGWRHRTATEQAMLKTVELCQKFNGDIIHCCFRNDPNSLFHKQLNWTRFSDTKDTNQIPEVLPLNLPVYWRSTYSCLTDETIPVIKKYEHVYIAGVFTDISVIATAMHIFDLGVPVSVVKDAIGTLHGDDVHKLYLKSLEHAIGNKNLVTCKSLTGTAS